MSALLLDTHALIWWFADDARLPDAAREAIGAAGSTVFASAVSAFEIATKHRIGKLPNVTALLNDYHALLASQSFEELKINTGHALLAGSLPISHRDPFDRLLIAQAQIDYLTLVSNEQIFDQFGVIRLWA